MIAAQNDLTGVPLVLFCAFLVCACVLFITLAIYIWRDR